MRSRISKVSLLMETDRYDPDTVYALEDESMEESGTSYTTRAPVQVSSSLPP